MSAPALPASGAALAGMRARSMNTSVGRLFRFFVAASAQCGPRITRMDEGARVILDRADLPVFRFTTNRGPHRERYNHDLVDPNHSRDTERLRLPRGPSSNDLGGAVAGSSPALLAWCRVPTHGHNRESRPLQFPPVATPSGDRMPAVYRIGADWFRSTDVMLEMTDSEGVHMSRDHLELRPVGDVRHGWAAPDVGGFAASFLAVIEIFGRGVVTSTPLSSQLRECMSLNGGRLMRLKRNA